MSISIVPNPNGAPVSVDYLVGTATGELSAEIVAGTAPGGELGGTWASPTVDATHSGSAHADYIAKNGTTALTADWDAGSFEIRAQTFESDIATGTAPLVIASTTKVANLNADLLDDQTGSYYLDSTNFTGANWTDLTDAGATTLHLHSRTVSLTFIIDGGGATITTGIKGDLEVPFAMTITGWTALADQSGSIVIDIWKDTYANFPPTVADTITASDKPTISTATKGQDLAPTGWTTAVTAGDVLRFNVDSITTCQRVTLSIRGTVP